MRLAATFSLVASAALAVAQTLQINTPTAVSQCSNSQLTWTGGAGPFTISILPGGQASAAPLEELGPLTASPVTWLCKQAANTQIFLRLKDNASGQVVESAAFTVQGGNANCLTAGTSSGASSSGTAAPAPGTAPAATSAPAPGTTSAPAAATPTSAPASNKTTSSSATAKAASASSSTQGGAGQLQAPVALAGVAALAMAVFA